MSVISDPHIAVQEVSAQPVRSVRPCFQHRLIAVACLCSENRLLVMQGAQLRAMADALGERGGGPLSSDALLAQAAATQLRPGVLTSPAPEVTGTPQTASCDSLPLARS